jgi:hypothetical protein
MITESNLKILLSVLNDSCTEGKVVPRSILFTAFQSKSKSEIEEYKFNKTLSLLINDKKIVGYDIKRGRNGGVFRVVQQEQISVTCSSGKFVGEISKLELSKLITNLKHTKR